MSRRFLIKYQTVNVRIECRIGKLPVVVCARVDLKLTFMNQSIDTLIHSNGDH